MALSPEQRALLELVRARGLTYEEVGELIGTDAEDARERVRAAEAAERRAPLLLVALLTALALTAAVLALAGVFSGDDQDLPPVVTEPAPGDQEIAQFELSGPTGSGSVAIGIGADDSPYLDLDLAGLEPPPRGRFHMLWVDVGSGRGIPLPDPVPVAGNGTVEARVRIPADAAGILEFARGLEVVLTDAQAIERITREVARAQRPSEAGELLPSDLPKRPGEAVLGGRIPG